MTLTDPYNEALRSGQYQKPGGLLGKYDNVRRFWEDIQLGLYLRPYLERLVARKKQHGEKLRVLDLGCGGGDGYELLTSIRNSKLPLSAHDTAAVAGDMLELYQGIDINEGLLSQARATYGDRKNMAFNCLNLNDLDLSKEHYDLYLANYGTLSHNADEQTIELLSKIARHSQDGAIIIVDWLGRFSYEWQTLWSNDFSNEQWMDYAISYIYAGDKEKQDKLTYFPLRLMGRSDAFRIFREARKKTGGGLVLRKLADRSSFVGRHIDTRQYNPHCQPLRGRINSLFEPNLSTDLSGIVIDYMPGEGFDQVNAYYGQLVGWWNYLVNFTQSGLERSKLPEAGAPVPSIVRIARGVMKRLLAAATRTKIGDPRASLVEPQLGYCLRELETGLQRGLGCGHGLVAVFEVVKQ